MSKGILLCPADTANNQGYHTMVLANDCISLEYYDCKKFTHLHQAEIIIVAASFRSRVTPVIAKLLVVLVHFY